MSLFPESVFSTRLIKANPELYREEPSKINLQLYPALYITESLFVGPKSIYVDSALGVISKKEIQEIVRFNLRPDSDKKHKISRRAYVWLLLCPIQFDTQRLSEEELDMRFEDFGVMLKYFTDEGKIKYCEAVKMWEEFYDRYFKSEKAPRLKKHEKQQRKAHLQRTTTPEVQEGADSSDQGV